MTKRLFWGMAVVFSMIFLLNLSANAVPDRINFQGKLTDADGNTLNGDYNMSFSLYDSEIDGTSIWREEQTVTVTEGIYNVKLGAGEGDVLSLDLFDNNALYLEIQIYNPDSESFETLSPRQSLTSTAFAMKAGDSDTAGDADTVDGRHADEFLYATDGTQTRSGGLNITGDVGIGERFGTSNPENPFTIDTLRTGTLTLDQLQTSKNFSDLLTGGWQSFTVNIDGPLTRIEVLSTSGWPWGNTTLKIYEGEGTDGGLLHAKPYEIGTAPANGLIVFEIPLESAPVLSKGSLYTFQIDGANKLVWADFSNPYLNGQSSIGSEYDLWFNTYINEDYNPGGVITVTEEGDVGIGTTSPAAKLEVNGDTKITGDFSISGQPATSFIASTRSQTGYTKYDITSVRFDVLGEVNTSTDKYVATKDGIYIITGTWTTGNIPNGCHAVLRIYKNETQVSGTVIDYQGANVTNNIGGGFGHLEQLAPGDEITIRGKISCDNIISAIINIAKLR